MKKLKSLLLASILTFFIFYLTTLDLSNSEKESVIVGRVIDGDTIELTDSRIVRLENINSPEKNTIWANLSKDFLKTLESKEIQIEISGKDKYNRYLGKIYAPEYLNLEIVNQGLASKFLVDSKELKDFSKAEEEAIKKEKGMWKKSKFFGCVDINLNKDQEVVKIKLICDNLNITNWEIKDESRKVYKFKETYLNEINLYSKDGNDDSGNFFWKSKTDIWNSDRDSVYIFDSKGNLVYYYSYGY